MYSILHELLADKKGGEVFTLFSGWHFLYILLTVGVIALVLYKNRNAGQKIITAELFLNIAVGLYAADFFLMPLAYNEIDIEKLPFHACTAMCVMCFLSYRVPALGKYRASFALLGLISNLVYLIYPAGVMWHGVHPLSYRVIQTLLFHSTMTVYGVLALAYDTGKQSWRRDLAVTVAMTLWAMLGNSVYNGTGEGYDHFFNWFFVVRDPFYIIPETVSPFVMPLINVALFFLVELLLRQTTAWIKRLQ